MGSFQYVIKDEVGMHARPAGMLVKKGEEITVSADSEEDLEKLKKFFEENL